jgi:hypothetical protein
MNTQVNEAVAVETAPAGPQLFYTREQVAKMLVARMREIGDEWVSMPDLTEGQRVHGAIAEVLGLLDNGNVANGIHQMAVSPQCDEVFGDTDETPLAYPIVQHATDIAGNLHQMYMDDEAIVAGQELADQYTNDIGQYLVDYTNLSLDGAIQEG